MKRLRESDCFWDAEGDNEAGDVAAEFTAAESLHEATTFSRGTVSAEPLLGGVSLSDVDCWSV